MTSLLSRLRLRIELGFAWELPALAGIGILFIESRDIRCLLGLIMTFWYVAFMRRRYVPCADIDRRQFVMTNEAAYVKAASYIDAGLELLHQTDRDRRGVCVEYVEKQLQSLKKD